ncbi:MAG TPA: NUDIX hydrolase [bacterium]|nr:NUDIX hydrolase [bacterium]
MLKKRADAKTFGAGQWVLPGGALELYERFEICAIRECQEETGVSIKIQNCFQIQRGLFKFNGVEQDWTAFVFRADPIGLKMPMVIVNEPDKFEAVGWFRPSRPPFDIGDFAKESLTTYMSTGLLNIPITRLRF